MSNYIGDGDGYFCKVATEFGFLIEKIAEDGYLKEIYEETLFSYQFQKSLNHLTEMGLLIREGDPDEFTMDEIEDSVDKLKMSVIELLGADAAIDAENEVEKRWDEMQKKMQELSSNEPSDESSELPS